MVDAGDSCTSCIPVVDGYVLGGALRSLPVAGRDVTRHVQKLLRWGPQDLRMALLLAWRGNDPGFWPSGVGELGEQKGQMSTCADACQQTSGTAGLISQVKSMQLSLGGEQCVAESGSIVCFQSREEMPTVSEQRCMASGI